MADPGKAEESNKNPSCLSATPPAAAVNAAMLHASSSSGIPVTMGYTPYPPPLATFPELVANPKIFLNTLQKLHAAMGTKFMTPIIGGRDLDLHRLFVEVTNRGGIEKVLRDKKWKEVTATFNFPSTATNASFILRKHYFSLLHHYEQVYYFQAQGWAPIPHAIYQAGYATPIAIHGGTNRPAIVTPQLPLIPVTTSQPQVVRPGESAPQGGTPASLVNSVVTGVIDGKFEGGYLVTVKIGDKKLNGVLYHSAQATAPKDQYLQGQNTEIQPSQGDTNATSVLPPVAKLRRRRRKKSEIRRRDPAHPKPNRSSYNFFFAEQHPRLKPLYQGRDREISRIIGELWTNLKEGEKTVYQEKAAIDKERYKKEMEEYREKLRLEVVSNAVPIQQRLPNSDIKIAEIKDYSEAFEDEEDEEEDLEEEEEEDSMSMSDYEEEEDAEEPVMDLNLEVAKKEEPVIKSSDNGVDESSVQEAAEAALMLSKSNGKGVEDVREAQEVEQKQGHDLNVVPEDQDAKDSTA